MLDVSLLSRCLCNPAVGVFGLPSSSLMGLGLPKSLKVDDTFDKAVATVPATSLGLRVRPN